MPALPPVPAVLRVDFHFIVGEDGNAKCRFFLQYSGTAPTTAQLNTFAGDIGTYWTAHVHGMYGSSTILDSITVTDLTSSTSAVGTASVGTAGDRTGTPNPASTAMLTSLKVARRYRGGHPRIYWPFGTALDVNDPQTWKTEFQDDYNSVMPAFFTAVKALIWAGAVIVDVVNVSWYSGFHLFTGPTGRVHNIPSLRLAPIVDIVSDILFQVGIAEIRKRNLGAA